MIAKKYIGQYEKSKPKTRSPPKTDPIWHRGYARGYSEASKALGGRL
jgi:hypothetical protein